MHYIVDWYITSPYFISSHLPTQGRSPFSIGFQQILRSPLQEEEEEDSPCGRETWRCKRRRARREVQYVFHYSDYDSNDDDDSDDDDDDDDGDDNSGKNYDNDFCL